MMQPRTMLISVVVCALIWSASQIHAQWSTPQTAAQTYCPYWKFRCNNGYQCVYRYHLCNGWSICSDGSDEWYWNCARATTWRPGTTSWHTWKPRTTSWPYWRPRTTTWRPRTTSWHTWRPRTTSWHTWRPRTTSWHTWRPGTTTWRPRTTSWHTWRPGTTSWPTWRPRTTPWHTWRPRTTSWPNWRPRTTSWPNWRPRTTSWPTWRPRTTSWHTWRPRTTSWPTWRPGTTSWPTWRPRTTTWRPRTTSWHTWSTPRSCQYWEFRCRNGQCIERSSLCDGGYDCYDGSDEDWYNCPRTSWTTGATWTTQTAPTTSRYCSPWEFRCRNGRCISKGKVCDNYDHCGDGSDELRSTCRANLTVCQNKLDLGFILDNSGSVGQQNFERMKLFVKDLADFYKLGAEETRISVISYSDSANIHIAFSEYFSDKTRFDSAVDRISYTGGGTATAMALNKAYNYMFTSHYGARGSEFKKVLVILTDGQSNTRQISGPARQLKNSGVVIFSVGIGQSLSMQELRVMASDPVNQRVITLDNFSQLDRLAEHLSSQTCNASNFHVFCDNDHMTAVFDRADLPKHVNIDRLYLRSRYCRADWNSTHVIVKTPLTGCGTVFSKNDQTLFFRNVLSEERDRGGLGVITRDYLFKANLTCAYPRKRTVGSFNFAPAKQRVFVNVGGQGNFSLIMDVFGDIDYRQPYASQDYPVFKSLSDNLYIQYSINTSNPNLVVRAETCRATPTNRPYDTPQYVFIADGCDKDETIRHYSYGMSSVQRFSMQAFRFLSEHRFVYLHCDLVVCHRYDYNSTCARSTSCSRRYRRDVDQQSQDVSGMYALSFGPVMKGKESAEKSAGAHSEASNTTLIGSLIGFGCLSLVLIGALLFMIQRSRRRRSDQTQNGVVNKGELSMQNLGYT